jgi:uncharacterized repeat protein (TIGR03803 family)
LLPPTAPGGAWRAGGILKFNGVNGANPIGNLIIAGDGTLYGVTFAGGLYGWGAVYQVERSAGLALQ